MEDRTLLSTFVVSNTGDSGPGSFRQAILDSNAATDQPKAIDFDIPGPGIHTIEPVSALPTITSAVLIDGFSQPGYSGTPLIELNGSKAASPIGLIMAGSNSTVRGLDIGEYSGTGVALEGAGGDLIEANVLGADPTGSYPLPDGFGVSINANNNTIGGSAAAGNLIAFNTGPGVNTLGSGNTITGNRIFSNDIPPAPSRAGSLDFGLSHFGFTDVSLPYNLVDGPEQSETLEAWFKTEGTFPIGGVIFGYQSASADSGAFPANGWVPSLYVVIDGKLRGGLYDTDSSSIQQVTSNEAVDDFDWHNAALVYDGDSRTLTLYLDGQLVGSVFGSREIIAGSFDQIGAGFTTNWPATYDGWDSFSGDIDDVRIWSEARSAGDISRDMFRATDSTDPGLVAYYPFDEGHGLTAHDQTPNHNDGTLTGVDSAIPTWVINSGEAIDHTDSYGDQRLPTNFPVLVRTAGGGLRGWFGGTAPDTTISVEFFASAGYGLDGAGQAEFVLGSIDVTTNDQGQAEFDVPFTPPADFPVVTATATDSHGTTSQVSAERQASFDVPQQYVRIVPGQSVVLSSDAGNSISLHDPKAGPLDPVWNLTLSAPIGTLTLSSLAGLAGSGNGTSTLSYSGALSDLNAALDGLIYRAPPDGAGKVTISLNGQSYGASSLSSSVILTDGVFSVTTTADSGPGSFRQAILDADATPGTTSIDFDIPGAGVQTITPLTALPAITGTVTIDGFSQPGYAHTPLIALSGSLAGDADGLAVTGANTTVRGLDIGDFPFGAGISIAGPGASGNLIIDDVIGTDAAGTTRLPNGPGVQISDGAHDNTVGGTDPAFGNLSADNLGAGVVVTDDGSIDNRINGNRIFGNGRTGLSFDGENGKVDVPGDASLQFTAEQSYSLSAWVDVPSLPSQWSGIVTKSGDQSRWYGLLISDTDRWVAGGPIDIYGPAVTLGWHYLAIVQDAANGTRTLYLDGAAVSTGPAQDGSSAGNFVIGGNVAAPESFDGEVGSLALWSIALSPGQLSTDMTAAVTGQEPGLQAYYNFDEGRGLIVHDLTPNHHDGTLESVSGSALPIWTSSEMAIDLGADGTTVNSAAPRQGPNNFQNFPAFVIATAGHMEGWLGGSIPSTTFRLDFFASPSYGPSALGEAQDYLGSMNVTTDEQGQVIFDIPFTAPAGLPAITATATDPDGNTSEVSAPRQAVLQAPTHYIRAVDGHSVVFSAGGGDAITLTDPEAGPLQAQWDVSISATDGTLQLSTQTPRTGQETGQIHCSIKDCCRL